MNRGIRHKLVAFLLLHTFWPAFALAQQPAAGVVTTIHGVATAARVAVPPEIPLKFRDDVFFRDRITTRENSIVRLLLGGKALVTVRELSTGTHRIQVTHDGFVPAERRVTITRARPAQSIAVSLDAVRVAAAQVSTTGTLRVESLPAGAKVYIDGRMIGTTPLSQPVTLGEHDVRLDLSGYREWTSLVRIAASETSRVTASLER